MKHLGRLIFLGAFFWGALLSGSGVGAQESKFADYKKRATSVDCTTETLFGKRVPCTYYDLDGKPPYEVKEEYGGGWDKPTKVFYDSNKDGNFAFDEEISPL